MNYKDVELLNGSLDQLGQSLLRNRMLEQQQQEQSDTRSARERQMDLEQRRIDATDRNTAALTADRTKAGAQRVWKDTVNMFGGWVKDGIMPPDVAQNSLKQAYEKMPDPAKSAVAEHPATQAILAGEPIWQKPSKPAPGLTPVNVPGFKGALTPGGAYVTPDADRPNEFDRLDYSALGKQLEKAMADEAEKKKAVESFTPAASHWYNKKDDDNAAALKALQDELAAATATREEIQQKREQLRGGKKSPAAAPSDAPAATKKPLDAATAKQLLQEAGGDKAKARQLAEQRGYAF